jgi:two-component system response regulator YesN
LNILIADADLDDVKRFRTFIRSNFPDYRVVGIINSADRLVHTVKDTLPNVILADIRLFALQAVNLVREVHEAHPDVGFIVYGSYSDTEYMEKVMEFGVIDYMYRPVKPADLERSLRAAQARVDELTRFKREREALIESYKGNMGMFRDRFIYGLTQGHMRDDFEIELSMRYFGVDLPKPYMVFSVRIDHFRKVILTLDEVDKQLLVYQVLSVVKSKLEDFGGGVACIIRMNAITAIVGGATLSEVLELCEAIKTETIYKTKRGVTVGVGRGYDRPRNIAVSFREAEAALKYRHIMGYNTVIPIHFAEPQNEITYAYPHDKEEALIFACVTGEYEQCLYLLRDITEALESASNLPERMVAKIAVSIVFGVSRAAGERSLNVEGRFNEIFPMRSIYALNTPKEASDFLTAALKKFCDYAVELREGGRRETYEKVKAYIDRKYFENISLFNMAGFAQTTPEYLNALFTKHAGLSIYEYTLKTRMERAKQLMRETDLDDEGVAVNVGYDDVKHFRSVFKQREGILPAQYRNSRRG